MAVPAERYEEEVAEAAQVTKERQQPSSGKGGGLVIREYPYQSMGVTFALGLLIGVLAGRSTRD